MLLLAVLAVEPAPARVQEYVTQCTDITFKNSLETRNSLGGREHCCTKCDGDKICCPSRDKYNNKVRHTPGLGRSLHIQCRTIITSGKALLPTSQMRAQPAFGRPRAQRWLRAVPTTHVRPCVADRVEVRQQRSLYRREYLPVVQRGWLVRGRNSV